MSCIDSTAATSPLLNSGEDYLEMFDGRQLLAEHTERLFGLTDARRNVRIMVTMPADAADDYTLVHELLQQGMNCMRINCAYGTTGEWLRIIEHLHRAEASLGMKCRVITDLGGAKLRTGPVAPGPAIVKVRPQRNALAVSRRPHACG